MITNSSHLRRSMGSLTSLGLVLCLAATAFVSAGVEAQEAKRKKTKPPTLRVRVVGGGNGLPVVVTNSAGELVEGGVADGQLEPEVENWLVDGPPVTESWLEGAAPMSAPAPAATSELPRSATPVGQTPPAGGSSELVGVQHYMESVGEAAPATPTSSPTTTSAPRLPASATSSASLRENSGDASVMTSSNPAAEGRYRLGPGDQIDIHVWRNPELTRNVPVRPDGLISLPLAGELMASGKTVAELEAEITAVLGEFVQYPTVTVSVTEVHGMVVYVVGRVASPGTLQLDRPINVIQAIAMAGGLQEFADRNGVVVIRTVNGQETRLPFPYGDALKGKSAAAPFTLQSGDVIYVP